MADDSAVVERGVLTAPAQAWDLAVRRAEVIGRLAERGTVSLEAADVAAAELGVSRRQVYALVRRWRAGEGLASDLLPRHLRWRSGWRAAPGRGGDRGAGSSADAVPDAAAANGGCGVPGGRAGVQGSRSAGAVAGNGAASHRQARPGAGGLGQGGRRRGKDAEPGRRG